MNLRYTLLILLLGVHTGQAHIPTQASFTIGLSLLEKAQYEIAQQAFDHYRQAHATTVKAIEAQYYAAYCAIILGRPDGEQRLQQFIKQHTHHNKAPWAHYQLGNWYMEKQDFAQSITQYTQVNPNHLDLATQYALQYSLAYAYLNTQAFDQAARHFEIQNHTSPYYAAANYYAGYLAFQRGEYETALIHLNKALADEAYQAVVPYLIVQVYYAQKRFQELLTYSQTLEAAHSALTNLDEITLLTAEACFFLQDYTQAAGYYEDYILRKKEAVAQQILYRTAYCWYKTQEFYKALTYFKEVALQNDALGQLASYYMGLSYIQTNQKPLALAAFDKAQRASFDPAIQAEATFHYAHVQYALGHFARAIETLQPYVNQAPAHHQSAAHALLSEAYLHTQDYALAITYIEGIPHPTTRIRKVYQQVTFYQGCAYFNDAAYEKACAVFHKSSQVPYDISLARQAKHWIGESLSALQRYTEAISMYQQVKDHHPDSLYGLAYAYFNTATYEKALAYFAQYTAKTPKTDPKYPNACVRLADCHYAMKNYPQALQLYAAAQSYEPAHVHYYQGVVYSLLGQIEAAQTHWQWVIQEAAHTVYYEKALFDKACTTFTQNEYNTAIQQFTHFMHQRPHSPLLPDALLKRAIAYSNLQNHAAACQDYETLIQDYTTHPNARNALLELPKLLTGLGKSDQMATYLATYQAAHPEEASQGHLALETARSLLYNQSYQEAREQLENFLTRHAAHEEATFLLAEAHYRLGHVPQAQRYYEQVRQNPKTPWYTRVLLRMATLAYEQADWAPALDYYQQLQNCATNHKERYYALAGIMRTSYSLAQYEKVTQAATLILAQGNIAVNATYEALLYLGKVAMQRQEYPVAMDYFTQLTQRAQDSHAAEAQYRLATVYYITGDYPASLAALFALNQQFAAYKVWTDKAFLLIADNYIALAEKFQAQATLQSIIEKATDPALVAEATEKLAQLTAQAQQDDTAHETETPPPNE